MPTLTYEKAVELAIDQAMTHDPSVVTFGEDVRMLRRELLVRHGPQRVLDTPISESAFLGAAVGAAMSGLRPIAELYMVDFLAVAFDAILNHATKFATFSGGSWTVPMVLRAGCSAGYGDGGQHGQSLWGMLAGVPGCTVVVPSTPADAAGLMVTALRHDGPVVFLEPKLLSDTLLDGLAGTRREALQLDVPEAGHRGEVEDPPTPVPFGRAVERRHGDDLLMVSIGVSVHRCLEAAARMADEGIEATVLDVRTAAPLDMDAVLRAADRTGHVLAVDEDYLRGGLSGEIGAQLLEEGLDVRFGRVATGETIPYDRRREVQVLPNTKRIREAAKRLLAS